MRSQLKAYNIDHKMDHDKHFDVAVLLVINTKQNAYQESQDILAQTPVTVMQG